MTTVSELIDTQNRTIAATVAQAQAYLDNLMSVSDVVLPGGDIPLPDSYNYATTPTVNFPLFGATRPADIGVLNLPAVPVAPQFAFSSIADIALPADDLLLPTNNFTYYEDAYSSILLDPLKAVLLDNLLNGGYGIETADEVALFNRARDREVEAALTRIEDAGRSLAMRGFPLPPGELSIHVDRAWQDMQDKVSDVSRDITLQRGKLYVENRQFTIGQIRELEQVLIGFHNSVQERALNVAKLTAEFVINYFNTLVARYKARLDAAKITSDVQLLRVQAESERARAFVDAFRGQVAGYEANLRGLIEPARLKVDIYGHDVQAVRATNDGTIAKAQLQQEVLKSATQQNIQISNIVVENARVRLLGTIEQLKFRVDAAKFGTDRFYTMLTALVGTINTLAVQSSSA